MFKKFAAAAVALKHRNDPVFTETGTEKLTQLKENLENLNVKNGNEESKEILENAIKILNIFLNNNSLSELKKQSSALIEAANIVDGGKGVYAPSVFDELTNQIARAAHTAIKEFNLTNCLEPAIKKSLDGLLSGGPDKLVNTLSAYLNNNNVLYESAKNSVETKKTQDNLLRELTQSADSNLLEQIKKLPPLSVSGHMMEENRKINVEMAIFSRCQGSTLESTLKSMPEELFSSMRSIVDTQKADHFELECKNLLTNLQNQLTSYLNSGGHKKKKELVQGFLNEHLTQTTSKVSKGYSTNFSALLDIEFNLRQTIDKHNKVVSDYGLSQGTLGNTLMDTHKKIIETILKYDVSMDKKLDNKLVEYAKTQNITASPESDYKPKMR